MGRQNGSRRDGSRRSGTTPVTPGPEVIQLFSCSTQLRMISILLINVKMLTIVGILTLLAGYMTSFCHLSLGFSLILAISVYMSSSNFMLS